MSCWLRSTWSTRRRQTNQCSSIVRSPNRSSISCRMNTKISLHDIAIVYGLWMDDVCLIIRVDVCFIIIVGCKNLHFLTPSRPEKQTIWFPIMKISIKPSPTNMHHILWNLANLGDLKSHLISKCVWFINRPLHLVEIDRSDHTTAPVAINS